MLFFCITQRYVRGLQDTKAYVGVIFCMACMFFAFLTRAEALASTSLPHDFNVFQLGTNAPTVLIIGGIQGDEPGGFSAATLLATRYTVRKGAIRVVPNLNFPSIIRRSRGIYGDMNRKFALLDTSDPQFSHITRIQKLITAPDVLLVLNLHDGSGYFRPTREGPLYNPSRWGQSIIIDKRALPHQVPMYALENHAETVAGTVNKYLITPHHKLHVRNTRTDEGNTDMEKSLSWYAVRHGKAAFGLEASKEFSVEVRTYYHLRMVEAFLAAAQVEVERDFELSPQGIRRALQSDVHVTFAENRIRLPLEDARPHINYLPLPRDNIHAIASKPIMAVLPDAGALCVHYGNRMVTRIQPDWREFDKSLDGMHVRVDGQEQFIAFGQVVNVRNSFRVHGLAGYRVNVIGAEVHAIDESDTDIHRRHIKARYSIDRKGTLYRVEVYKQHYFAGMFLVRFGEKENIMTHRNILPGVTGEESLYGY